MVNIQFDCMVRSSCSLIYTRVPKIFWKWKADKWREVRTALQSEQLNKDSQEFDQLSLNFWKWSYFKSIDSEEFVNRTYRMDHNLLERGPWAPDQCFLFFYSSSIFFLYFLVWCMFSCIFFSVCVECLTCEGYLKYYFLFTQTFLFFK